MQADSRRRDVHGIDAHGMVACNPRDREAAHRAEQGDIQTGDLDSITCKKCVEALRRDRREGRAEE